MTRVEVDEEGPSWWAVSVDGKQVAMFNSKPDAQEYAARKRDEIAKARPYYVDGNHVCVGALVAATVHVSQMPNGTPQVTQRKLLEIDAALLNNPAELDRVYREVAQ